MQPRRYRPAPLRERRRRERASGEHLGDDAGERLVAADVARETRGSGGRPRGATGDARRDRPFHRGHLRAEAVADADGRRDAALKEDELALAGQQLREPGQARADQAGGLRVVGCGARVRGVATTAMRSRPRDSRAACAARASSSPAGRRAAARARARRASQGRSPAGERAAASSVARRSRRRRAGTRARGIGRSVVGERAAQHACEGGGGADDDGEPGGLRGPQPVRDRAEIGEASRHPVRRQRPRRGRLTPRAPRARLRRRGLSVRRGAPRCRSPQGRGRASALLPSRATGSCDRRSRRRSRTRSGAAACGDPSARAGERRRP